jgi:hypothetical protein
MLLYYPRTLSLLWWLGGHRATNNNPRHRHVLRAALHGWLASHGAGQRGRATLDKKGLCVSVYVCVYLCMYVCMCVCVGVCVCVYVCVYV